MNAEQGKITLAFVVVFGYLTVRHHWVSRALSWFGAKPTKTAPEPLFDKAVNDWEAAIIVYAILLVLGATSLAPVSMAISTGLGVGTGLGALKELAIEYPALFTAGQ